MQPAATATSPNDRNIDLRAFLYGLAREVQTKLALPEPPPHEPYAGWPDGDDFPKPTHISLRGLRSAYVATQLSYRADPARVRRTPGVEGHEPDSPSVGWNALAALGRIGVYEAGTQIGDDEWKRNLMLRQQTVAAFGNLRLQVMVIAATEARTEKAQHDGTIIPPPVYVMPAELIGSYLVARSIAADALSYPANMTAYGNMVPLVPPGQRMAATLELQRYVRTAYVTDPIADFKHLLDLMILNYGDH